MRKRAAILSLVFLTVALCCSGYAQTPSKQPQEDTGPQKENRKIFDLYRSSIEAQELLAGSFFPPEAEDKNGYFFYDARFLAKDPENNIYVSDTKECAILKIDRNGRLIKKYAKRGQGPGDLLNCGRIFYSNSQIVVYDQGNSRIQFFDQELNYLRGFKLSKEYLGMDMSEDGRFYAAPIRITKGQALIEVFNNKGEILDSFGLAKDFKEWQKLNFINLAVISGETLGVAYWFLPVVQLYSYGGELKKEMRIDIPILKNKENMNLENNNKGTGKQKGYTQIFGAIGKTSAGFAVVHTNPRMDIIEFDYEGNPLKIYWFLRNDHHITEDFIEVINKGPRNFYVLSTYPDNKVEIFRTKESH